MLFSLKALLPLLLIPASLASPIDLETRQSATTCGNVAYTQADAQNCRNAAFSFFQQGSTAGGSTYPHTFNNREGFDFAVNGPYQEFPLKKNGAYTGGSPGADRCVINTSGAYAGSITHTGASGNNFVGCSGTS